MDYRDIVWLFFVLFFSFCSMIAGNYIGVQGCNERVSEVMRHFYNVGFDDCKKQVPESLNCPSVDCGLQCIEVLREKCNSTPTNYILNVKILNKGKYDGY